MDIISVHAKNLATSLFLYLQLSLPVVGMRQLGLLVAVAAE